MMAFDFTLWFSILASQFFKFLIWNAEVAKSVTANVWKTLDPGSIPGLGAKNRPYGVISVNRR